MCDPDFFVVHNVPAVALGSEGVVREGVDRHSAIRNEFSIADALSLRTVPNDLCITLSVVHNFDVNRSIEVVRPVACGETVDHGLEEAVVDMLPVSLKVAVTML